MSATNRGGERDVLDRYYTPDALALACVRTLPKWIVPPVVIEPSVGGGAFVRAIYESFPGAITIGVDVDEDAAGLRDVHTRMVMDFQSVILRAPVDLVVGNPPYRNAEEHVRQALSMVHVHGRVGFVLRLAFLESMKRRPFWREFAPEAVSVITPRPSFTQGGTDSAAYAWFVWRRHNETCSRHAPRLGWLDWEPGSVAAGAK